MEAFEIEIEMGDFQLFKNVNDKKGREYLM